MNSSQVWVEIDRTAYGHNIHELKHITRAGAQLMAVVKANGYGHGAVEISRTALKSGAEWLGVARLHEALDLRQAGIEAPILIFGATPADQTDQLLTHDLTQTVFSVSMASDYSDRARAQGKTLRVHCFLGGAPRGSNENFMFSNVFQSPMPNTFSFPGFGERVRAIQL